MFGKRGTDEFYGFGVRDEETGLDKHKNEVGRGRTGNWPRGLWLAAVKTDEELWCQEEDSIYQIRGLELCNEC